MEGGARKGSPQPVGVAVDWKDRIGGTPEHVRRDLELGQLRVEVMSLLVLDP